MWSYRHWDSAVLVLFIFYYRQHLLIFRIGLVLVILCAYHFSFRFVFFYLFSSQSKVFHNIYHHIYFFISFNLLTNENSTALGPLCTS